MSELIRSTMHVLTSQPDPAFQFCTQNTAKCSCGHIEKLALHVRLHTHSKNLFLSSRRQS